ncbi:MAG: peptidyl-alpha-hydroxyglycine alpha-amidating lyase family protein [Algoriphagus sp.]|nr:peptidyl-alpha-hydroxyglycine alpha-amidating lyase family protein [Algoriphagus sp.]
MKINTLRIYLAMVFAIIYGCQTKSESAYNVIENIEYELVADWPQLTPGYQVGQPTGIGIDSDEHIFVFHRAGRRWTTPFPDSLISENTILELENETGKLLNSWGANHFIMPHGLTVDQENNIWVTDVGLHQVLKFSHDGQLLMKLGVAKISGNDSLHFNLPTDVAIAEDGSFYVSDGYGNSRVVKFSPSGNYLFEWGTYGDKQGQFDTPHGITLDDKGNVYVADRENNRIQKFDSEGVFLKEIKNNEEVAQIPSVTFDAQQNLFAIDYDFADTVIKGSTIFQYGTDDTVAFKFGGIGTRDRTASWYHDISVDRSGNIYVGDIHGIKVRKFRIKPGAGK